MPRTANEELLDATLRHQIQVRRLAAGEVRRLIRLMEQADKELTAKLRERLAPVAGKARNNLAINRIRELLASVRDTRKELIAQVKTELGGSMRGLSRLEADVELKLIRGALPIELKFNAVPIERLQELVAKPFAGGSTLGQWFDELRVTDQARLVNALQLGIVQGETVDQMVKRIAGTKANHFADGLLAVTRRNAETIVRTAVNHVSTAARESVWTENSDIVAGLKWVATLDGRTSAVCRARDGRVSPLAHRELPRGMTKLEPLSARPPAHPNCRSMMVAYLDGEGIGKAIGERPTMLGNRNEVNFRELAKTKAGAKWVDLDAGERNELMRKARNQWTKDMVGSVPANVNYEQWLKRQPAAFQDDVLGNAKGALFRRGGLKLDQFVDKAGNELNLEQLAETNPTAFMRAGLDPEDFE